MTTARAPLLVIAALPIELAGRQRTLPLSEHQGPRRLWARPDHPLALATTGVGRRAIEQHLPPLLERTRPHGVVLLGVAGGCAPELRPAALVVADRLVLDLQPCPIPPPTTDPELTARLARAAAHTGAPLHRGPLATTTTIAIPSAKDSLHRNLDALACDMEAGWAAAICRQSRLPFACARAIFDTLHERLPEIPPEQLGRTLLRRPTLALHLPRLALRMARCRTTLGRLIDRLADE